MGLDTPYIPHLDQNLTPLSLFHTLHHLHHCLQRLHRPIPLRSNRPRNTFCPPTIPRSRRRTHRLPLPNPILDNNSPRCLRRRMFPRLTSLGMVYRPCNDSSQAVFARIACLVGCYDLVVVCAEFCDAGGRKTCAGLVFGCRVDYGVCGFGGYGGFGEFG